MQDPSPLLKIITGHRVCLDGKNPPGPATLYIGEEGKIQRVEPGHCALSDHPGLDASFFLDAGYLTLLPGLVDAHVHLNEPGRTEWEGFFTGTRAAVQGGCTTVVDMPLNAIPPTTTVAHLDVKKRAAQGQCHVDVSLWGGMVPGNALEMRGMMEEGVGGFKGFLIDSGVEEFPAVTERDIRLAFEAVQGTKAVLMFHAEMELEQDESSPRSKEQDPRAYTTFLESRPSRMEEKAIHLILRLCEEYQTVRCHIVHLSAASAIPALAEAQKRGVPVTVETCAHYLTLQSQDIPDGQTQYKCCPPIRDGRNKDLLWQGLLKGVISMVVSDHSPCLSELKRLDEGDFLQAWGGVGGVGYTLALVWTEAARRGDVRVEDLVKWLCVAPAQHAGLEKTKGSLLPGHDADLVVWDPEEMDEIRMEGMAFKNKVSPYIGMQVQGRVHCTILRGKTIYHKDHGHELARGRVIPAVL
ncbi:allantoinase [Piptocephalis cylindrospora]|uniref:allantoinase n=1 Tax=Piptocephalis cylindrospora TaxID=1907219 RepID=A0A4P9Y1N3_9FUNG|nr:allantoinase [Piptocephalis cylindrospora]|eukprot:RKP12707.1 allantoinase [Piptocephalis cylindrospora]